MQGYSVPHGMGMGGTTDRYLIYVQPLEVTFTQVLTLKFSGALCNNQMLIELILLWNGAFK
jgi:hypothetical protein